MKSIKSLLVTTSNNQLIGTNNKTGIWLEDLAAPYFILKDAGEFVTIASPLGGKIPIDKNSETADSLTDNSRRFLKDPQAVFHLAHSIPLNEIRPEEFDLVFLVGGYGCMWDFTDDEYLQKILNHFIYRNKPVGLVGHAVVALTTLMNNNGLDALVKGREITAFTNEEEALFLQNEKPPFMLESKLISQGALYSNGPSFKSYVVADDNIVTGQNPASCVETARQALALARRQVKLTAVAMV